LCAVSRGPGTKKKEKKTWGKGSGGQSRSAPSAATRPKLTKPPREWPDPRSSALGPSGSKHPWIHPSIHPPVHPPTFNHQNPPTGAALQCLSAAPLRRQRAEGRSGRVVPRPGGRQCGRLRVARNFVGPAEACRPPQTTTTTTTMTKKAPRLYIAWSDLLGKGSSSPCCSTHTQNVRCCLHGSPSKPCHQSATAATRPGHDDRMGQDAPTACSAVCDRRSPKASCPPSIDP